MATLTIRGIPDDVRDRLRVRAARNGRSMEAEVRGILVDQVTASAMAPDAKRAAAVADAQAWVQRNRKPTPAASSAVDDFIRDKRRELIIEVIREGADPAIYFGDAYGQLLREAKWTRKHVRSLRDRTA